MTWQGLALKNSIQNIRRYIGYLLSSSVAVMVFFMFSCFVNNPAVTHGHMPSIAKGILVACEFIVILFALFFIFFFHSALLRIRGKEFGLFIILGV